MAYSQTPRVTLFPDSKNWRSALGVQTAAGFRTGRPPRPWVGRSVGAIAKAEVLSASRLMLVGRFGHTRAVVLCHPASAIQVRRWDPRVAAGVVLCAALLLHTHGATEAHERRVSGRLVRRSRT